MTPNPAIMQAVEHLGYRVTPGDIAAQAGMDIKLAEQGLLALASDAGGHLQVSETGEIAYLFPTNFRGVLRSKFLRLRLQDWGRKIWNALFYLIRISFAILLIASIVLIVVTIALILIAMNSSSSDGDRRSDSRGSAIVIPRLWLPYNWYGVFSPGYRQQRHQYKSQHDRSASNAEKNQMNFFEAVFSFLFGDGNPNADLEERRWQAIATIIRNHRGAIVAEQVAPYLDNVDQGDCEEFEAYMLPVLTRFNGRPEVSPEGHLVYHFPELQVTAAENQPRPVAAYLKESLWQFSQATSGQMMLAAGLGVVNLVGAIWLGILLADGAIAAQMGGLVAFVSSIYGVLLAYGIGFLAVPLVRYFWLKLRNVRVSARNLARQQRAEALNQGREALQQKLAYARQFALEVVVDQESLAYTTETDLAEQEYLKANQIDAEWQQRLERQGK